MDLTNAEAWEIFLYAGLLLSTGALAGFLAGLFGVGGGAVIVPVLYEAFGAIGVDEIVRMHLAIGTSIAVIVPTSVRSYMAHRQRGAVDEALLRSWIVMLPIGVVAAIIVAGLVGGAGLRGVFAALVLVFAVRFLLLGGLRPFGEDLPPQPMRGLVGLAIGFFSTLMGVGGGIFNNSFMTAFGRSMIQAVATSAGVGVLISIPAFVGYVIAGWGNDNLPFGSLGYVSIAAAALLVPTTILMAPVGVRIAHAMNRRLLEIGFGIFLLIVATRFVASLI